MEHEFLFLLNDLEMNEHCYGHVISMQERSNAQNLVVVEDCWNPWKV
jgi:hypothetical protein